MAALLLVNRMARTSNTHARSNEYAFPDIYRRSVQDDTVVVQNRKSVEMDIEAVVTMESGSILTIAE